MILMKTQQPTLKKITELSVTMKTCFVALAVVTFFAAANCTRLCSNGKFKCPDGLCLGFNRVCDGIGDCDNDEDEGYELARCGQCPDRNELLVNYRCRKICTRDSQCRGSKRCRCDGNCGMSCFNPTGSCDDPPPAAHSSTGYNVLRFENHAVHEVNSGFRYGDIVNYRCPAGMVAIGPQITCTSRRHWTPGNVYCAVHCQYNMDAINQYNLTCGGDCVTDADCDANQRCMCDGPCGRTCVNPRVNCTAAPARPNARIEYRDEGIYRTANYMCEDGYFLRSGDTSLECSGSGQWYGNPVTCQEIFCGDPTEHLQERNLRVVSEDRTVFPVNSTVQFLCADGFVLSGSANRTCLEDGRWSGIMTACQRRGVTDSCPDPGWPVHGTRIGNNFAEGQEVTFECDPYYVLSEEPTQTCLWTLEWSGGTTPECIDPRYPDRPSESLRKLAGSLSYIAPKRRNLGRSISITDTTGHDITFIFDASISISNKAFYFAIAFAKNLVKRLKDYKHGLTYGIIAYASEVKILLPLHEEATTKVVLKKLDELHAEKTNGTLVNELRGNTATAKAIGTLGAQLGLRERERNKHAFLFTDGMHNEGENPMKEKNHLQNMYKELLEFYTVTACGSCADLSREAESAITELRNLASKKENFIKIQNYYMLNQLLDKVVNFTTDLGTCGQESGPENILKKASYGRVVGGKAVNHTWPWQAAIMDNSGRLDIYDCFDKIFGGGSLINQQWVLTAAHVFDSYREQSLIKNQIVVAVGLFKRPRRGSSLNPVVEVFQPRRIYLHPQFDRNDVTTRTHSRTNFDYDVALIRVGVAVHPKPDGTSFFFPTTDRRRRAKFNGTIPLSPYVRPVCLPCSNSCLTNDKVLDENGNRIIDDTDSDEVACKRKGRWLTDRNVEESRATVVVAGFGRIDKTVPYDLQEAQLQLKPERICRQGLELHFQEFDNRVPFSERLFCAGSPPNKPGNIADACQGDSGGPLIRKYRDKTTDKICWIQIGIVSFGIGCAHRSTIEDNFVYPGYYTDVSQVQGWIDEKINSVP